VNDWNIKNSLGKLELLIHIDLNLFMEIISKDILIFLINFLFLMAWDKKSLISIRDLDRGDIEDILEQSKIMHDLLNKKKKTDMLRDKVVALLFFEPSTRTMMSFDTAAKRLGATTIGFSSSKGTSVEKGESLADTVRVISEYADLIAIRHPLEGSARYVSEIVDLPVINCGDGGNQHPTQTLLDLYTIWRHHRRFDIDVCLMGDLKHARTMKSLFYALGMMGARIHLVSPPGLELSPWVVDEVTDRFDAKIEVHRDIEEIIDRIDVLYSVRIQKERFTDVTELSRIERSYRIKESLVKRMKENSIIMHPLPRVDEVDTGVDGLPQAVYFKQAGYGVPVRMAVLSMLLGD